MASGAGGPADQVDQSVARRDRIGSRAGVTGGTGPVNFACSDASKPDPWSFLAPHRSVAIPHGFCSADKSLAGRHDRGGEEK